MFIYIQDNQTLKILCVDILSSNTDWIALDTEFVRHRTKFPSLSLIQISNGKKNFIIDILSENIDLSPLKKIFAKKTLIKVIHSAKQDIALIKNVLGFDIVNVFDTQIAAKFDGFRYNISYQSLVKLYLNQEISKESRISNWLKRPLSKTQTEYAINDVKYLYKIFPILKSKLEKSKKLTWVIEDCLCDLKNTNLFPEAHKYFLKNTSKFFGEKRNIKLALARRLFIWRNKKAYDAKINPEILLGQEQLRQMINFVVNCNNCTSKKLEKFCKKHKEYSREIYQTLFKKKVNKKEQDEIQKILHYSKIRKLQNIKNKIFYQLEQMRSEKSAALKLSPELIADKKDLLCISYGLDSKLMNGWRFEIFGKDVKKYLESLE